MEQLIALLTNFSPLSPGLEAHLRKITKYHDFRKRDLLLKAGDICNSIMFVESGLTRSFKLIDGKEVTNWFMEEGNIIVAVVSFFRQLPAKESIEALEPCRCLSLSYAELEEIYVLFPEYERHARLILQEYYCRSEDRHESQHMQKPDYKYAYMMKTQPGLISRVTREEMASYLNVSVRTYANIRKRYSQPAKKKQSPKKKP